MPKTVARLRQFANILQGAPLLSRGINAALSVGSMLATHTNFAASYELAYDLFFQISPPPVPRLGGMRCEK